MTRFRVLGPVEAWSDEHLLVLGGPQQLKLLAFLLLNANRAVSADAVIDAVWGSGRDGAAKRLQMGVVRLRKALAPLAEPDGSRLRTVTGGYLLEVGLAELDAEVFAEGVRAGRRALEEREPARASESLTQALALWRGPPLADVAFEEFAQPEIRRLEELRLVALETRIDADLQLGRHTELIAELEGLLAQHPTRERSASQLMTALYRSGRQADALDVFQRTRVRLAEELGLEPGPALRTIQAQVLSHDPALGGPTEMSDSRSGPSEDNRSGFVQPAAPGDAIAVAVERKGGGKRRKVVTVLLCDLTATGALGEELDPEALDRVMDRYWLEVRLVIEHHGGSVDTATRDTLAVFGVPQLHEDDAIRAVRAAAELRERLHGIAEETGPHLAFRAAVNTGLALISEDGKRAVGDAISIAAGLQHAADPDDILIGAETARLVRDAVEVEPLEPLKLKAKPEPVRAFRLLTVDPLAPGIKRHFERPLVDRQHELGLLRAAWRRTVDEPNCHLFTLFGTAGVGKSRLVSELFLSVSARAHVLSGRCLPYGEGITFWPLIEALTPLKERARQVLERLVRGGAATPEELFVEVRGLLESLAMDRPVILHIDDLQWAESMLLDLIDHVSDMSRGSPILVLCAARPELLEERAGWGGGKLRATTALLEPLETEDCELLLDHLGDGLLPGARATVIAACGGNPLFLEEMVALAREGDAITVPPTIHAVLAARIEQLPVQERRLLELAAIEGEIFHVSPLRAIAQEQLTGPLEASLTALVRKELIRPHQPVLEGDRAFRFRHLLIRDAAYDGLSKVTRAALHERYADWLEQQRRALAELEEIVGWHLEQAVRYHRELGLGTATELAQRAAEHLHIAGRRGAERGDTAAARSLLQRAHTLAPQGDASRTRIGVDLAEQLIEGNDLARVHELLEAAELDETAAPSAALVRFQWLARVRPHDAVRTIDSTLSGALERLSEAGDERGLAEAHMAAVSVHWMACRAKSAADHAWLAAEHAGNAGNAGLRSRALGWYLLTLMKSPASAATIEKEIETVRRADSAAYLDAFIEFVRAELARLDGRFDDSRRLNHRAIELWGSMEIHVLAAACWQGLAETELSAGDPASALSCLLRADAGLAHVGESGYRSTVQALLSRVYELLGEHQAARNSISLSDDWSPLEDRVNYAITQSVRARLALDEGMIDEAERWARSAVEQAYLTDLILHQAKTKLELARILAVRDSAQEAMAAARSAHTLYEAKGDRSGAAEAKALIDQLSASTS